MKRKTFLLGWLVFATPAAVQAQFDYTVTNQTVTITGYTGSNGVVAIPTTIDGLPVTSIGVRAFAGLSFVTTFTIPTSVTDIGDGAFSGCTNVTSVTIPSSVTSIGNVAFTACTSLTNVMISNSVSLIGKYAFANCTSLTSVFFRGNAPVFGVYVFDYIKVRLYYLPGTVGWTPLRVPIDPGGSVEVPTTPWTLPYPIILTSNPSFGVQSNQFGFTVSWATNLIVVVEAATDLANPIWSPVQTNPLMRGWFYFSDPPWKDYPARVYRVRWP